MPQQAETYQAEQVQSLLHRSGFEHLRARKHGATVIVASGPKRHAVKHFRLRRDTVHLWCLDLANHTGRWEQTPFRDQLKALVAQVVEQFPWTLTQIAPENPERTSDLGY